MRMHPGTLLIQLRMACPSWWHMVKIVTKWMNEDDVTDHCVGKKTSKKRINCIVGFRKKTRQKVDFTGGREMQYNYVVTAHKPSNVNLSVTGRKPALIATPILPSCPSAVLAALPSLSRLFAPSSPSSLVLPPLPSTSEDALFSVHACPFRSAFDPFAAAKHPCTTHTHLPLHPFRSSFHHLLDLFSPWRRFSLPSTPS